MKRAIAALLALAAPAWGDAAVPAPARLDGEAVHFVAGKTDFVERDRAVLESVAATLRANPRVTRLRLDGHTDGRGAQEWDLKLSRARAEAVRAWLIAHGVDGARLAVEGFGKLRPIADNRTAEGRARNSRVEFTVVELDGKPIDHR
jgi:OOP family OmpA-OmpF porin